MRTERPGAPVLARGLLVLVVLLVGALAPAGAAQVMDSESHGFALLDRLELAPGRAGTPIEVDAIGWWGGDVNRLWIRAEAEQETEHEPGELQAEALYGRLVAPYWDALFGVRVDHRWGEEGTTRALLAVGLVGLAPLWIELEPTLYVSQDGDVSAVLEAEYDLLVTQRLVLQPRFEAQVAVQDVPELGVGSGLGDLELGARLRYELRRELSPYLGVSWHRRVGETADLARAAGEDASSAAVLVGLRVWY
jgi:copper resistance protein B